MIRKHKLIRQKNPEIVNYINVSGLKAPGHKKDIQTRLVKRPTKLLFIRDTSER